jgi:FKBP-type peptidyl-prolyl cis-trans isomerase SlpA
MNTVTVNSTVKVNYTGKLENGDIFDSSLNEGREPLIAKLGMGKLIRGFEAGLVGMTIGESKTIEIEPKDAYGLVSEDMIVEVPIDNIPKGAKVGDMLQSMTNAGPVNVSVISVNEKTVTLDANHPLAVKKLIFELEVLEIN